MPFGLQNTEQTKDVFIFGCINLTLSSYFMFGTIVFYMHSYLKHFNPIITMKEIFGVIWVLFFGNVVASWAIPFTVSILGLKNAIRFGALLNALNCFFFHWAHWFPFVAFNTLILGFVFKFMQLLSVMYFQATHPDNSSTCYSLSGLGMNIGSLVWTLLFTYYINPSNEQPLETNPLDASQEVYFSFNIAGRFASIMNIQALFVFLSVLLLSFQFDEPEVYQSNFRHFFKWILNKENSFIESIDRINNSFSLSHTHSISDRSGFSLTNSSFESDKTNETDKEIELISQKDDSQMLKSLQERVSEQLWSAKFWLFFIISIFRRCFFVYIFDYNKVIGILIIHDDHYLSFLNILGSVMSIIGSVMAPFLEKKLGILGWYITNQLIYLVFEFIGFTILRSAPFLFSLLVISAFIVNLLNSQFGLYTIFSQYETDVALELNKIFELHLFLSTILLSIVNTLFFSNDHFERVFEVFFVLDLFALMLILFVLKPLMK